jgi:hypothetical protein
MTKKMNHFILHDMAATAGEQEVEIRSSKEKLGLVSI